MFRAFRKIVKRKPDKIQHLLRFLISLFGGGTEAGRAASILYDLSSRPRPDGRTDAPICFIKSPLLRRANAETKTECLREAPRKKEAAVEKSSGFSALFTGRTLNNGRGIGAFGFGSAKTNGERSGAPAKSEELFFTGWKYLTYFWQTVWMLFKRTNVHS